MNLNWTIISVLAGIYVVMSLFSFVTMARDKRIAQKNARRLKATPRVPERRLHSLEALGGWLGSFIAQRTLRHKVQQRAYQLIFRIIVFVHLVLLVVYLYVDWSNRWF